MAAVLDVAAHAASAAGSGDTPINFGDPNENFEMPSVDEVWKIIEQMDGISEEEKANLRESLYNPKEGTAEDFMRRATQTGPVHTSWDYAMFFAMIAVIVFVFALFGYKVYKSLTEKDRIKKEKLKSKQAKKSKKTN